MAFILVMLEDVVVFILLLAASPLVAILLTGHFVLSSIASTCDSLCLLFSDALYLVLGVSSGFSSNFSSLAQIVSSNIMVTQYAAAWIAYQTTVGLPKYGARYCCIGIGAR